MKDLEKLTEDEKAVVIARREYYKKWRSENAAKVKANQARFFLKHAAKPTKQTTKDKKAV